MTTGVLVCTAIDYRGACTATDHRGTGLHSYCLEERWFAQLLITGLLVCIAIDFMAVGLHSYGLQGCGLHSCLLQGFRFAQVLIVGLLVFTVIGCRAAGICFPDFRTAQGYCGAGGRGGITPESTSHLDILLKLFFPLSPSFPPSLLPFFLSPSPAPFS